MLACLWTVTATAYPLHWLLPQPAAAHTNSLSKLSWLPLLSFETAVRLCPSAMTFRFIHLNPNSLLTGEKASKTKWKYPLGWIWPRLSTTPWKGTYIFFLVCISNGKVPVQRQFLLSSSSQLEPHLSQSNSHRGSKNIHN